MLRTAAIRGTARLPGNLGSISQDPDKTTDKSMLVLIHLICLILGDSINQTTISDLRNSNIPLSPLLAPKSSRVLNLSEHLHSFSLSLLQLQTVLFCLPSKSLMQCSVAAHIELVHSARSRGHPEGDLFRHLRSPALPTQDPVISCLEN